MSELAARIAGPIASAIARRFAEAYETAMATLDDEGRGLTQLQKIDLLEGEVQR